MTPPEHKQRNLQVAENTPNSPIDNVIHLRETHHAMGERTISFRATKEDAKIIDTLAKKLGVKTSQIIKIALRRIAEAEGLKLKAS